MGLPYHLGGENPLKSEFSLVDGLYSYEYGSLTRVWFMVFVGVLIIDKKMENIMIRSIIYNINANLFISMLNYKRR